MGAPRANSLDGTRWTKWSVSPWSEIRFRPGEKTGEHPCPFPLALAERVIACYTGEEQTQILDPFAGVGTTLVAAHEAGKHGIGFEINHEYFRLAYNRLYDAGAEAPFDYQLHDTSASFMAQFVSPETVDLAFTSPPYWRVMAQRRSADKQETRDYSDGGSMDLCRIESYDEYLRMLGSIFEQVSFTLRPKAHLVVDISDLRIGPDYYPLHADLGRIISQHLPWTDSAVWDRKAFYNNLRPLGYPYRFMFNRCQSHLLVFRKPA